MKRTFTSSDRRELSKRIEDVEDYDLRLEIFQIMCRDRRNRYTSTQDGAVLDLARLSDKTLRRVTRLLDRKAKRREYHIPTSVKEKSEPLSPFEKDLIRYGPRPEWLV